MHKHMPSRDMSEHDGSSPSHFVSRMRMRQLGILVLAIGVPATVFGAMAKIDPAIPVGNILHDWEQLTKLLGVFCLYALYLLLVVNHGLLNKSVGEAGSMPSWMPFLLLAAYVLMPVDYFLTGSLSKLSTIGFLAVYAAWAICCIISIGRCKSGHDSIEATENTIWLAVDLLVMTKLAIDIYPTLGQTFPIFNKLSLPSKDLAVLIGVIGSSLQAVMRRAAGKRQFPDSVAAMIDSLERVESDDIGIDSGRRHFADRLENEEITVLDFGSGNSHRTLQLLDLLSVDRGRINLVRFDTDETWNMKGPSGDTPSGCRTATFISGISLAKSTAKHADIVIACHSLYNPRATSDFQKVLRNTKPGTTIIIRGASPQSFLAPIIMYRLYSWMRPFYAACWDSNGLRHLSKPRVIEQVSLPVLGRFPIKIGQKLVVRPELIDAVEMALESMYGWRVALSVRRMMSMAITRTLPVNGVQAVTFNNPDLVYFFTRVSDDRSLTQPQQSPVQVVSENTNQFLDKEGNLHRTTEVPPRT